MLGLCVNTYMDAVDEEDYKFHRTKASTMDLADMSVPRTDFNMPADEGMPPMETDDDEPGPSVNVDAILQALDVTPLRLLAPSGEPSEYQGTPAGCTGSSAGATQDVLPALTSGAEPFGTPGGCSTSVSPKQRLAVPKMETLDVLDQRSRPTLDLFRNTRRRMKKTPYVELPEGAIIEVSDEDEGDIDIMVELGVEFDKNKRVKEEALSVAELNAKLEQKMKEDMAAAAEENARKMRKIEEELKSSNEKTDAILAMLTRLQNFAVAPQAAFPFPAGYPMHGPFPGGHSYQPAPHPTPVGTPPPPTMPTDTANIHDAISAAIREDEDLRTHVRESSGPTVLTPPPPRVGLPSQTDTAPFTVVPSLLDRTRGDDTARHTDLVIVEDTQGSPSDTAGVQRMDVEDSPAEDRHPPACIGDVHMETLDLGGEEDDIQQTQTSQAARADDVMETEAPAAADVTNARSLIAEEGAAAQSSAAAPPSDDEVTHL
jgi:hypothetical protein